MGWIKLIAINGLILFALLGILLVSPPAIHSISSYLKLNESVEDSRSQLPLYSNYSWASQHFKEFRNLQTSYHDYITWRRDDFNGETITIKDGVRQTISTSEPKTGKKFWFFGGSTTWGTGVSDRYTYPSLFSQESGFYAANFAETSYIARQSLSYFSNILSTHPNYKNLNDIHVVFYDGVNDVLHRCRPSASVIGSRRESQVRSAVRSVDASYQMSFQRTFSQLQESLGELLGVGSIRLLADRSFDYTKFSCAGNSNRAREVAETLVATWQVASDLTRARGGRFTAILQPVSFIGSPMIDYLDLSDEEYVEMKKQYQVVYPLIKEIASASEIDFVDLTEVFNKCDNCYVDFCHAGPQGNSKLVTALKSHLLEK